ncbi:MAG: FG-GAP-like repeat-containing protein [Bacteroidales bacterium]|nr:FG-GAP-like repeat-containing protein [Bacteroidales bacterium]
MKKLDLLLLITFLISILTGCRNIEEKASQKSTDLITTKTLGLAYLEEFKLEEAEKEFLKFIDLAPKEKLGYANLGLTYLRMNRYPEAEKQLMKAIKTDPKDPDIRLILATVYKMNNEQDRAIDELKDALTFAPDHIKILYEISELYSTLPDIDSQKQRENYIISLVEKAPGNLVPRLNLTDILIRDGEFDKALEQMEIINKQFPEFPKEAVEYYDKTLALLRCKDKENAIIQFTIFHNYLKVTSPYQAGIIDLKGPGGSLIGFPVITFDRQSLSRKVENVSLLDVIRYTNATSAAGLDIIPHFDYNAGLEFRYSTNVAACDYDGDEDIDLYVSSYDPGSLSYKHYLFNNEMGKYADVTKEAGLKHSGKESSATFSDFDNDGFPDLFIMKEGGDILYRNTGKGTFENVTDKSKAGSKAGGKMALFFDMDHDGDLDLFEILSNSNLLLRNNADGTFEDQSVKLGPQNGDVISSDAVFGDFNDDVVIDFIVVNKNSGTALYSNQRQGVFKNISAESGLTDQQGAGAIAAGDYNNDGYLDLFIALVNGGNHSLLKNLRNGTFEQEKKNREIFRSLENVNIYDASFLDFNNDGFLDLLVAGESKEKDGKGVFFYYNDGAGNFTNVSGLLPAEVKSGRQITVFDYNNDGDLDVIIAGLNGGIFLLRNDGGNNNHFITMKLVGLRAGSAKNNHFGIGAKVEVRAGDLYQTMVVTDSDIHFGIGSHAKADVIRIIWTNGVPQNKFFPGSDQALIEEQTLKGSCPFLYTWNGDKYVFVKDILWRSALGMPTGIMGGTTSYAFADASDDYLKIPGDVLKPNKGSYSLQVTSELWETIYIDKLELIAVDHPDSLDIFVPEQFGPPPFPGLKILKVKEKHIPVSAKDSYGNDVLSFISEKDDNYLSGFKSGKYQGITEMKDLIIDPGDFNPARGLFLFMNGWIFPTDASINVAISQSDKIKVTPPLIQVINKNGDWETVIDNLGFPMGKDKTVIADLSGKFLTKVHRIRIRTNMEIYWDQIFFSENLPDAPVVKTVLDPVSADLHYRGFSKTYRKGGRYGPHWFDYSVVEKGQKWRDIAGNYTRFGDVLPLLSQSDNKYIITNAGDETTVEFNAATLPPLAKGWERDFLIRNVGWVKDGDLNTALGNTVLPLPFKGMKSYPPSENDIYPDNPELQKYNREYNTRVVTADEYINAVRGNSNLVVK